MMLTAFNHFRLGSSRLAAPFRQTDILRQQNRLVDLKPRLFRTAGKPRPRVRLSPTGEATIHTGPLRKKYKWKEHQVKNLMIYLDSASLKVKTLPELERLPALQEYLNDYIRNWWGRKMAERRRAARIRRQFRLKRRATRKIRRNMLVWQKKEDMKEQKVIRDQLRKAREARGELFSFKKFLVQAREAQRIPPIIHDEKTFEDVLQHEINTKYIRGPASSRRKLYPRASYSVRFMAQIVDPVIYQLKKKGYITQFIRQHEKAILDQVIAQRIAERRALRAKEKEQRTAARLVEVQNIFGQWHEENAQLTALKREYCFAREAVYANARKEFLRALNAQTYLWSESPDECKFMRFRFGQGVEFPFNNTYYR